MTTTLRPTTKYRGVTYPPVLGRWPLFQLWRRFLCRRHMHLFDEVWSPEPGIHSTATHYLVCDACQFMVHIASFETTYSESRTA